MSAAKSPTSNVFRMSQQSQGRVFVDTGRRLSRWPLLTVWLTETLSFLLSLVAIAAIVITLSIHAGRPLPQWPHMISINALIAIFTAVLKAALLVPIAGGITRLKWLWFMKPRKFGDLERFDSASRGPWGSLVLLFRLQGRHVAALGAFITVVSIAIDPFSQQIIQYYDCSVPIKGAVATVPISNFYTQGFLYSNGDTKALDANMTAAVYLGLITPPVNATASISSNCPTGNCTISTSEQDTYSSIAMCSDCVDISDSIQNTTVNGTMTISYKLPSGAEIGKNDYSSMSMYVQIQNKTDPNQDLATIDTLLAASYNAETGLYTPFATRCSLKPCVNTYVGNITNGVLLESLVSSTPMTFYGAGTGYYYSLVSNETVRNNTRITCTSTPQAQSSSDICSTIGYTPVVFQTPFKQVCWPQSCVWTLGMDPTGGLSDLILYLLNGSAVDYIDSIPAGSPWSINTWNLGNTNLSVFQHAYAGLADQITSVMRQKGDNSTLPLVTGTVSGLQTCIGVRWSWLSFPASLLLLTAIFFVVTVTKIATSDVNYIWKASSLALLFHGLRNNTLQQSESAPLIESEDAASQVVGQLRITPEGFTFSEVDTTDGEGK